MNEGSIPIHVQNLTTNPSKNLSNTNHFNRFEVESYHDLGLILKRIHMRLQSDLGKEKLQDIINKATKTDIYDK